MVRFPPHNLKPPINLLQQHQPHELMWEGHRAEGEAAGWRGEEGGGEAEGAADEEGEVAGGR